MESSSSKIFVEYHDPAGIFSLVASELKSHLPLRNLHWQSASRPLRQIRTLNIEFIPDAVTETLTAVARTHRPDTLNSSDEIVRAGQSATAATTAKERRHQIPGLKTTPYLKIYVLRCDDKEQYRNAERKNIRDWIRDNLSAEGQLKHSHDSFDWMILHVVVPDTIAASEPRWRDPSTDIDELRERSKSTAKWPGKSIRTVFDRVRADFNESSKNSPDRVAQIRLQKSTVPPDLLPTPANAVTLEESVQERQNTWGDLIAKMKILILGPFDARVRHYEADVAVQESRRALPGWNFCTFFMHKEGLAKALESIGLTEDALAIYDELTLGLEATVRDLATGAANDSATAFADITQDIHTRIMQCASVTNMSLSELHCREQIARSSLSLFDFFGYLFSRQKALILRMADTSTTHQQSSNSMANPTGGNLVLWAEACRRTIDFIHNNSHLLQQDLAASHELTKGLQANDQDLNDTWIYAMAEQVLIETDTPGLHEDAHFLSPVWSTGLGASTEPSIAPAARHPSNAPGQHGTSLKSAQFDFQQEQSRVLKSQRTAEPNLIAIGKGTTIANPGQVELQKYRARLLALQKVALESIAARRGWTVSRTIILDSDAAMQTIDLKASHTGSATEHNASALPPILRRILSSEDTYHRHIESLCNQIVSSCILSRHARAADTAVIDLAFLKVKQGDYATAASYFNRCIRSLAVDDWGNLRRTLVAAHAVCLLQLDERREFVSVVLDLTQGNCEHAKQTLPNMATMPCNAGDNQISVLLKHAILVSKDFTEDVCRPMERYFAHIHVADHITPRRHGLGFRLCLSIRHLISDPLLASEVCLRLVASDDSDQEIWVVARQHELVPGPNQVQLESSSVAFGTYLVDRVKITFGMISFVHDWQHGAESQRLVLDTEDPTFATNNTVAFMRPSLLLYPSPDALKAKIGPSLDMDVAGPRMLEVQIVNGSYDVSKLHIKVRPSTAGLRIYVAKASLQATATASSSLSLYYANGEAVLEAVKPGLAVRLVIPYDLETQNLGQQIRARLEVVAETVQGVVTILTSTQFTTALPLDVDVNDMFHVDALYSSFTVRVADKKPLYMIRADLQQSEAYTVHPAASIPYPVPVTEHQPVKLMYKVVPIAKAMSRDSRKDALALSIQYCCIDELCRAALDHRLEADLKDSNIYAWTGLLSPLISQRISAVYTADEVMVALLTGNLLVKSYDHYGWSEIFQLLPVSVRKRAEEWLRVWHRDHHFLTLDQDVLIRATARSITIRVDVPTVDLVYDISLTLDGGKDGRHAIHERQIVTMGEPLSALLCIRSTDRWSKARIRRLDDSLPGRTARSSYEVHGDTDRWHVGGSHRAYLDSTDSEIVHRSRLTLTPCSVGTLTLPTVSIRMSPLADSFHEPHLPQSSSAQEYSMSCESNLQSAAEVVQVIRDAEQ